jgi:HEAT repeat protein
MTCMATRLSLDDKLAALRGFRGRTLGEEERAGLKKSLVDRSNLVVAAAAELAGENTLLELAPDLEAAFARFLVNPVKDDKLCRAKIAIVQALDKMEHLRADVFEKAAVHVQHEPVWGGTEDTAAPLRAAAIIALARIEGSGALPRLVDAMVDPSKDVRIAAAQALGYVGTEAAGLVLRLKARIGDAEPDVLSECLSGLLTVNPRENLAIVAEFLTPDNAARCEAAALALGKSRLPDALERLKECWPRCFSAPLRQRVLLAIAMMRLPAAIDYLIGLVASDSESDATAALAALKIHNYDPRLRERLEPIVRKTGSRALRAAFDRDFRSKE